MSRFEWEKRYWRSRKITATLWKGVIDKIRFEVKIGNHTYEDEFYGANEGLTVAELSLSLKVKLHETKLAWNRGDKWQSVLQFKLKQQSVWKLVLIIFKTSIVTSSPSAFILQFPWKLFERSISLDFTKGPLSVTSTITDCPFLIRNS
jgi:hypothetical protein